MYIVKHIEGSAVSLILPFDQLFSRRRAAAAAVLLLCAIALTMPVGAHAANVNVAAAANFTEPAKEIAQLFQSKTKNRAILSFGATGQFYTQITQGAPFQVFLSV